MDDIIAKYTLVFNDLASKGILRSAAAGKLLTGAFNLALAGVTALTAGVLTLTAASFKLAGEWAEYYDSLDETAQSAGVSAQYLRNLTLTLSDMGVEQEAANKSVIKFNQILGRIHASGIPKALSDISGNFGFLTDKSLTTEAALQRTLETIAALPDAAARTAALTTVFGKGGAAMGAAVADLAALNAGMQLYNDILGDVSAEQLTNASDYSSAMLQATSAWNAIKLAIGQNAAPLFIPYIKDFVKFLVANKDSIMKGFADAFGKLGEALKKIDFGAVMSSIATLVGYIPNLVSAFSFVVDHAVAFGAALAAIKIAGLLSSFGLLGTVMSGLATGFTAMLSVIGPVGWAILAVVAAGVLLYKNWDLVKATAIKVGAAVMAAWDSVNGSTGGMLTNLLNLGKTIGGVVFGPLKMLIQSGVWLYQNWDMVKAKAVELYTAITGAWATIDGATNGFLSNMLAFGQSLTGLVFAPIQAAIALLSGDFSGALSIMRNAWGSAWGAMGAVLGSIWATIKQTVATGIDYLVDRINGLIAKYNAWAPAFAQMGNLARVGVPSNGAAAGVAAARQSVAVAVSVTGQISGARIQTPSVRTSQAPRGGGGNHPAQGRR